MQPLTAEQADDCRFLIAHGKNNPTEGEPAIALGRAAGAAKRLGDDASAQELWAKLEQLVPGATTIPGMPTLDEFYAGYTAHPGNFAAFADKKDFDAKGFDITNATGCYARALAHLAIHQPGIINGEKNWAYDWGVKALTAAGLDRPAQIINSELTKNISDSWVGSVKTSQIWER